MHSGFSVLVALLLSLFHHGAITTNTTLDANVTPTVTVTVTPSVTPSDTPSVSPTDTPSITPSVTPVVSPTVTPSVTPSVSPSGTPNPSGTPQGEGDKDDMWGFVPANIKAFFGLSNAASHHEQNEQRFEQKHGTNRDGK